MHSVRRVPLLGGPSEAFQSGTRALRAGDTKTGVNALEYAAANGHTVAQWKLGRMYADGDGVKHDDMRAFEYFRGIADAHAEEAPGTAQARFVANAFVALGNYYLEGIPGTAVKPDTERAREMYAYAASYFGDPDAQYRLGRMYLDGNGGLEGTQAGGALAVAGGAQGAVSGPGGAGSDAVQGRIYAAPGGPRTDVADARARRCIFRRRPGSPTSTPPP